jgi:hypothetical protein
MTKKIFSNKDYNSNNGMSTTIWGPMIWTSLHIISFNYPTNPSESDKIDYKIWLLSYKKTLPCAYCRINFDKNLKSAGFSDKVFNNRNSFSRFIYRLHNCVNIMLGKKKYYDYEHVRELYEHFRSTCSDSESIDFMKKNTKSLKYEKKCNSSLHSVKSKSVINIVPNNSKISGINIDNKCKKKIN